MKCNRRHITIMMAAVGCMTLAASLLCGCHRATERKMNEIEAVLNNALDSATILPAIRSLDSIPAQSLNSRHRALHALLTVHSRHKQHLSLSSDSIIFKDAAYFENSSDTYHRMKWHFYRGATRLELQDYRGAIFDALHATRLSSQLPDTLFMAKSEELLADIYDETFNVTLAIKHRRNVTKNYEAINNRINSLYASRDLIRELVFLSEYNDCIAILDSILENNKLNDRNLLSSLYFYYALIYSDIGEHQKADSAMVIARQYYGADYLEWADLAFIGGIFKRANNIDSVRYYIGLCDNDPYYINDVTHLANQEWLAKQTNDYAKACHISDSIQRLHNLIVRKNLANQESIAQADYYIEIARAEEKHSSTMFYITLIVIIVSILIISAGIILHIRSKRALSEKFCKMEQYKKEIATLKNTIDSFKHTNHKNSIIINQLKDILQSEYSRLDAQINEYALSFNKNTTPKSKTPITKTESNTEPVKISDFLNNVIDYINVAHDNIISNLILQIPQLKTSDIQIIALKLSGFSSQSICIIMNLTSATYYTRWHRLRAKISQSDATDKDSFIKVINNL